MSTSPILSAPALDAVTPSPGSPPQIFSITMSDTPSALYTTQQSASTSTLVQESTSTQTDVAPLLQSSTASQTDRDATDQAGNNQDDECESIPEPQTMAFLEAKARNRIKRHPVFWLDDGSLFVYVSSRLVSLA